jgi:putative endopeptidase
MKTRLLSAALLLAAATTGAQTPAQTAPLDRRNMDTTCAACADFYRFANGGWLKRTSIPAAYPSYGAFRELRDRNEAVLHEILEADATAVKRRSVPEGSVAWKVGAFYATCMDTAAIERRGAVALKPDLDLIAAIRTRDDLVRSFGALEAHAALTPMAGGSIPDSKDAANTIASLTQGGLSLPTNEYYAKSDSASVALRSQFVAHVERMFRLLGDSPAEAAKGARAVLAMETRLARASKTPVERRDRIANYNKMSLAQLDSLTPHLRWQPFFAAVGAPTPVWIDVAQPRFFRALDSLVATAPVEDWRALLRWRAVHNAAPALSYAFVKENFVFEQIFSGEKEILPRWKRCARSADTRLGELLGQEYVKRTFTPEAKTRAVAIVENLIAEFRQRIQGTAWMSEPTKREAVAKLDAFGRKIGYPDEWLDYSQLTIVADDYFTNARAADRWSRKRNWGKVNKPTVRTEWRMTPPTVNAYANPLLNEIVFPAGILQPPFFDPNADDAVNYGAMGAVIGHEMSHLFDDQGRKYDKTGNLRDWWTKEDADRYVAQADRIVKQFDAYTVIDTATHVNGKLTLGENLGDFGGLTVAYYALQRTLGDKPRTPIDGFTPEQRFFLGWAQLWRELARPEHRRTLINSNTHAPGEWRVNGPLSMMPEFQAAWACKEGDPMVRSAAERAKIW